MLNIIKMDLYRMLKTKSMYVIWIVLAAILLITTSLCKTDYELSTEKDAMQGFGSMNVVFWRMKPQLFM